MASLLDKLIDISKSREFKIFWIIFFVYMLNPVVITSNDVTPTRLLPISIIRERNFDLNEFIFLNEDRVVRVYYQRVIDGKLVSQYPIFTAILAVPFYFIPVLMGLNPESINVLLISKLTATTIVAASAIFLYWTLKRISSEKTSLGITLVYAFGTSNWTISAQDLWQHGPGELFICMTIYLLTLSLEKRGYVRYAGLTMAMAVAIRPTNAIIALVITAYVLLHYRKQLAGYIIYALPVVLALFAYSIFYIHSIEMFGQLQEPAEGWSTPLIEGLLGLLISPNVGLFVYSPVFILSIIGVMNVWMHKEEKHNTQMRYYSIAVAAMILLWSKWWAWHGMTLYGNRMLLETLPFLCLFLVRPMEEMIKKRVYSIIVFLLIAASIFVNFAIVANWSMEWYAKHNVEGILLGGGGVNETRNLLWSTEDIIWIHYARNFAITFDVI